MEKTASTNNSARYLRPIITGLCLGIFFFLSIFLKSGYYRAMPFLPDGDTYYPGMMAKYIIATGHTTTNVPFEVPATPNGAPLVFPILITQIYYLTHIPILAILRWFGPIISAVIGLTIFALIRRTTRSDVAGLFGYALTLFIPLYSGRLSSTFPESIIIFFIPILLLLLINESEQRQWTSLLAAIIISVSAIGYHFVSYLLWPVLGLGVLLFFVGKYWKKRNAIFIGAFIGLSLLSISLLYSNWWLFGFLQSLFHIYSGSTITGTGVLSAYAQPPPTVDQWYEHLGYIPVILSIVGSVLFFIDRQISWRTKIIVAGCVLTILLPLEILPALKLFSYTPWRAFVYLTPPLVFLAAMSLNIFRRIHAKKFMIVFSVLIIAAMMQNYGLPQVAGPGEQQLTKGEYHGFAWLRDHANRQSVIITAPANGRQMVFLTNADVAYDTGLPVFNAKTTQQAIQEIHNLGQYDLAYIYISKYKLGPVYNFGGIREYANVRSDLTKFSTSRQFKVVFEDADSLIFEYRELAGAKNPAATS